MHRICTCPDSAVLAFWLMGVFLGYMLTFRAGLGVRGLWIGIMSGDFTAGMNAG